MAKNQKKKGSGAFAVLTIFCVVLVLGSAAFVAGLWMGVFETDTPSMPTVPGLNVTEGITPATTEAPIETTTVPPETTLPEPEKVVATATISSMGDVLMHLPVVNTGKESDGSYNFDEIIQYIKPYV